VTGLRDISNAFGWVPTMRQQARTPFYLVEAKYTLSLMDFAEAAIGRHVVQTDPECVP
jgi:hypothetical protein